MKNILKNLSDRDFLIKEKSIGFDQIRRRLERSHADLDNARLLIDRDSAGAFRMAYDAMLQAGISLILSYGYRPKVKNFHKTVVEATKEILGDEYAILIKRFDQIRKSRHDIIYDIAAVSGTEAEESIKTAERLIKEISGIIKSQIPQQELL